MPDVPSDDPPAGSGAPEPGDAEDLFRSAGSAHGLLIAILALQNGFIDHRSLIAAIQAWATSKTKSIGTMLVERGELDSSQLALLQALALDHIKRHGGDPQKSLAAFAPDLAVRLVMEQVDDPEVEESLSSMLGGEEDSADRFAETLSFVPEESDDPDAERFRILDFLAAGNLGRVSVALDRELRRKVAFKEIQERLARREASRNQFMLEGLITGGLEHPGIVPVYGLGRHKDGRPYYAMRLIRGPSLREKIDQLHKSDKAPPLEEGEDPPTLPKLLRPFISACYAVAYAHSRGILHRDLKPVHIMLGPYGEMLVVVRSP